MAEANWEINNYYKFAGYPLSQKDVNLVYVPVGKLPKSKIEKYLEDLYTGLKKNKDTKKYKFLLIPFSQH